VGRPQARRGANAADWQLWGPTTEKANRQRIENLLLHFAIDDSAQPANQHLHIHSLAHAVSQLQSLIQHHTRATNSRWPDSALKCKNPPASTISPLRSRRREETPWLTRPAFATNRTNLIIILGVMQVAKKIPFDDPFTLNLCRAAYALSNILILGIYLYIKAAIDKKKGKPTPGFSRKYPMTR